MQLDRTGLNFGGTQMPLNQGMQQPANIPASMPSMNPSQQLEDASLMKQCKEFESVLCSQMFKQMRPKAEEEDLFGNTKDREMFNSMLDDERAKVWSQEGGIGLANIMFQQMKDINKKA